jgi:putative membrane protein
MNNYIDKTVKRYSYLFTLPSHRKILILLLGFSLLNGILATSVLQSSLPYTNILVFGFLLGVLVFVLTLVADFTVHSFSFRRDLVFNLRRCSALSMYSVMIWSCFNVLGVLINISLLGYWFKIFLVGFCVVLALRLLVLSAVSFANVGKIFFYSVLLPILYVIPVIVYKLYVRGNNFFDVSTALFFFFSLVIVVGATLLFMYIINRVGISLLGVGSFSVLRAFLANWAEDLTEPFEQFFERFGLEHEIRVSTLAFKNNERVKALMVISAFHPGPFKNVGSSNLPYAIQKTLEDKLPNCVVAVPHGLSGHDLDLASQTQNQLLLDRVRKLADFSSFDSYANQFLRVKRKGASVGCQIFNNCAFVSFTLAPETMEDLPPGLDSFVLAEAHRLKLAAAISVDAHNSIQGNFTINEAINPLKEAAKVCLEKASQQKPSDFEVGVAKVVPPEFGLLDGMGPGGIIVNIVKVAGQHTAYVTIDGNNMISGLREKILSALYEIGIDDGEIFTTDTHAVNAVVLDARGYHPVGEVMEEKILIEHIKQAAAQALANLEPAEAAWRIDRVSNVKVIGEKQIEDMCKLVDKAIQTARRSAVSIFPLTGIILGALLLLL